MDLELIARNMTPLKFSPAFYRTSRGTYVIQGWKVDDATKSQAQDFRADDEDLIEVPQELLHLIVTQFRA